MAAPLPRRQPQSLPHERHVAARLRLGALRGNPNPNPNSNPKPKPKPKPKPNPNPNANPNPNQVAGPLLREGMDPLVEAAQRGMPVAPPSPTASVVRACSLTLRSSVDPHASAVLTP